MLGLQLMKANIKINGLCQEEFMSLIMNPVFISSTLQPVNRSTPSEDPEYFRNILTKQLHACDCAKEVCFCGLPVKSKFWNLFGELTMLLLLRVVHLPPAKNDKSILNSKSNKLEWNRNWERDNPTSDTQLVQRSAAEAVYMENESITAPSALHNSCFSWNSYKTSYPLPPQGFPNLTARIETTNYLLACSSWNKLLWIPVSKCQQLGQHESSRFKSRNTKESKT